MDAVTSSLPPAGAPTFAVEVWIRPDVQAPLLSRWAINSRLPLPSRWVLGAEEVMVSISPVPNPVPVSCTQTEDGAVPSEPLKSSLNTVVQPDGGPGTLAGAAIAGAGPATIAATRPSGTMAASATVAPRRRCRLAIAVVPHTPNIAITSE